MIHSHFSQMTEIQYIIDGDTLVGYLQGFAPDFTILPDGMVISQIFAIVSNKETGAFNQVELDNLSYIKIGDDERNAE